MIGSAFAAEQVAARLERLKAEQPGLPIVFDPVMVATSGAALGRRRDGRRVRTADGRRDAGDAQPARTDAPDSRGRSGRGGAPPGRRSIGCAVLIKGGHEEGDALADALIEDDNMTSWQGQRIDTTSTHGTGCTLASAIATFPRRGLDAGRCGRPRARIRPGRAARGAGAGAGRRARSGSRTCGSMSARPLRLNQVTVTGTNYERSVEFYRRLGLKQIVDNPPDYARFEMAGRRDLLGPDRPRGKDHRDDRDLSRMRRSRRARRAAGAERHPVRARPAQPAVDVARGAAARPRRQHHLPLQGGRSAALPAVADGRHEATSQSRLQ